MKNNLSDKVQVQVRVRVEVIVVRCGSGDNYSESRGTELYMSGLLYIEFDELKIFFKK